MPTRPDPASAAPDSPAAAPAPAPPTGLSRYPSARPVAVVAAVTIGVLLALWAYGNRHDFFDLRIYVAAMRWWADGHDLYAYAQSDRVQGELYFTYPPFAALLLRPFADIPIGLTIVLFTIGTIAAVAVTTWWLIRPLADRHGWPRWFAAGLAIPLVFLIEPTRETITFGQINMLLVVLIMADLLIGLPRNARWAGVGIGLATALKLFPGIFIVYLLLTRRVRAAATAATAAAGATLVAAAIAPSDSWDYWTSALWDTDRVGRTDYTGNQSLLGMLSRIVTPDQPNRLIWLIVAGAIAAYGLWRAARASAAGDDVAALTLTGLVGALISPITWPHHLYWFIPALVVMADAVLTGPPDVLGEARRMRWRWTMGLGALALFACIAFGVVSFLDYGPRPVPTTSAQDLVVRNAYVLLSLALLAFLPIRAMRTDRAAMPVYTRPGR
jgi:alpha-1,2-mannosyltransferase